MNADKITDRYLVLFNVLNDEPVAHLLSRFNGDCLFRDPDRRAVGPVIFLQHRTTDCLVIHLTFKLLSPGAWFEDLHT